MMLSLAQDSKLQVTPCALLEGKGQALRPPYLFLLRRKGQALHQRSAREHNSKSNTGLIRTRWDAGQD